jgi:ParB-like chromosome segregation protein Spo0J|tara:strand:+ start:4145 stop:4786 length:642 start_codon:yes stop_codon:yes gene_type:complete
MKLEYVKLHEIEEADVNPKDHDIGEIYMSMKRFGFTEPPVRNETTGKLVAGHGRIETLKVLEGEDITKPPINIKLDEDGNWLVPVIAGIHFKSDDEAKAYLIASNRLTEIGGWKSEELIDLLQDVAVSTEDLAGTGYQLDDIENMLSDLESKIFVEEEIDEAEDETTVRFKFGRYKFGVDAEYFYEWEAKKIKELGTNSPQALTDYIKQQLGL